MKITASELKKGVEVDMPVEWKQKPVRQLTIKYHAGINRFVLADIRTKEVHAMYENITDLVRYTNQIYNYNDVAVED